MKTPWTSEELEYIRQAYSDGKREKVIALELGRSEASVSKAITRHKLRQKRNYRELVGRRAKYKSKPRIIKVNRILEDKTFSGRQCNWTSAEEVLRYLGENSTCFTIKYINGKTEFFFDGQPVSLAKVLMEANRIRLQHNLDIFHIEEVTE